MRALWAPSGHRATQVEEHLQKTRPYTRQAVCDHTVRGRTAEGERREGGEEGRDGGGGGRKEGRRKKGGREGEVREEGGREGGGRLNTQT